MKTMNDGAQSVYWISLRSQIRLPDHSCVAVRPPIKAAREKSQVGLLLIVVSVCVCCRCCVRRRRRRWRRRTCRCLYCCCCVSFRMLSHGQNDLTNVLASSPVLSHESWSDATRPLTANLNRSPSPIAQDVECRNKPLPVPYPAPPRAVPTIPNTSRTPHLWRTATYRPTYLPTLTYLTYRTNRTYPYPVVPKYCTHVHRTFCYC